MGKLLVSYLLLAVFTLTFFKAVYGIGEACDDDTFCNEHNKERCQKYDACTTGRCVCQPGSTGSLCKTVAKLGVTCNDTDLDGSTCGSNALCNTTTKTCGCPSGLQSVDEYHCYGKQLKLNGEACTALDPCNTAVGLNCPTSTSICACASTHTWVNNVINPTLSSSYSVGFCVHKHAKYGLSEGDRCTTPGGTVTGPDSASLYCGKGLTCSSCPEELRGNEFDLCLKTAFSTGYFVKMNFWVVLVLLALNV